MPSGLFRGKTIKQKRGKLTRTQTAGQARRAIKQRYGRVVDGAYYYHRGNGRWAKYSPARDAKIKHRISRRKVPARERHMVDSKRKGKGRV